METLKLTCGKLLAKIVQKIWVRVNDVIAGNLRFKFCSKLCFLILNQKSQSQSNYVTQISCDVM